MVKRANSRPIHDIFNHSMFHRNGLPMQNQRFDIGYTKHNNEMKLKQSAKTLVKSLANFTKQNYHKNSNQTLQ